MWGSGVSVSRSHQIQKDGNNHPLKGKGDLACLKERRGCYADRMNHIRISTIHALVVACMVLGGSLLPAFAVGSCSISGHFLTIVQAMPETVGDCRGPESVDPDTGDLVQPTSGGWLVFHESDESITFTDGVRTWGLTSEGVTMIIGDATPETGVAGVILDASISVEALATTQPGIPQVSLTPVIPPGDPQSLSESAESLLARSGLIDSFTHTGGSPDYPGAKYAVTVESRALPESQHVATFNRASDQIGGKQRALIGLGSTMLKAALDGIYRTVVLVTLPPGIRLTDRALIQNSGFRTSRPDGSTLLPGGLYASIILYENGIPFGTRGYTGPQTTKLVFFYSPDPEVDPRNEDMMDGALIADQATSIGPNFASRRNGGLNEQITYFFMRAAIGGAEKGPTGLLMRSYAGDWGFQDAMGFHGVLLHSRSDWKPGVEPTPRPLMPTATPRPPGFDPRWYIEKGKIFGCLFYKNQSQAQAVLRADPSDPNQLDTDRDGIACNQLPIKEPYDRTPVARPTVIK